MYTLSKNAQQCWVRVIDALRADVPQVLRTDSFRFVSVAQEAIADRLAELELAVSADDSQRVADTLVQGGGDDGWNTISGVVCAFCAHLAAAKRARLEGRIDDAWHHERSTSRYNRRLFDGFGVVW